MVLGALMLGEVEAGETEEGEWGRVMIGYATHPDLASSYSTHQPTLPQGGRYHNDPQFPMFYYPPSSYQPHSLPHFYDVSNPYGDHGGCVLSGSSRPTSAAPGSCPGTTSKPSFSARSMANLASRNSRPQPQTKMATMSSAGSTSSTPKARLRRKNSTSKGGSNPLST